MGPLSYQSAMQCKHVYTNTQIQSSQMYFRISPFPAHALHDIQLQILCDWLKWMELSDCL